MKKPFFVVALVFVCASGSSVVSNNRAPLRSISRSFVETPAKDLRDARRRRIAPQELRVAAAAPAAMSDPLRARAAESLVTARAAFEPVGGATASAVQFVSRRSGMNVALTDSGILVAVPTLKSGDAEMQPLEISVRNSGPLLWSGEERLNSETNYFFGNNPLKWQTQVPNYSRVEASGTNGIGLAVYHPAAAAGSTGQGIEFDVRAAAGTDPAKLRLILKGAQDVHVDGAGDLVIHVTGREVRMNAPAIFEEVSTTAPTGQRKSGKSPHAPKVRSTRRAPLGARRQRKPRNSGNVGSPERNRLRKSLRGDNTPQKKRPRKKVPRLPLGDDAPAAKKSSAAPARHRIKGGYVLDADGSVGIWLGPHDPDAAVVIDPSISLTYETFLGGTGADTTTGIALDSSGNVYVGGTTTAAAAFPEGANAIENTEHGSSQLFLAKIAFSAGGTGTLEYLDFFGGSETQYGGGVAVDPSGNAAILGATTSSDYPVTDARVLPAALAGGSGNAVAISEVDPTGGVLLFSTLFGGSGSESLNAAAGIPLDSTQNIHSGEGGIAIDAAGNIYIASDTTSPDLPVTAGAYATALAGKAGSDGFLAEFQPQNVALGTNDLVYCTYLNTDSDQQVAIGGVAVDAAVPANVYIAGLTNNSVDGFNLKGALQSAYGGGSSDAFLMKISPAGGGAGDLIYATLLGGSGMDEALGVAVDTQTPANAYVVGATQSVTFPETPVLAGPSAQLYQSVPPPPPNAPPVQNAFLAVVSQNAATAQTSLQYFTYLGGAKTDAAQSVISPFSNAVYMSGTTKSYNFPWHDNLQPFNGGASAFAAKIDTTKSGTASLVFATPLAGAFATPGAAALTEGSAIAADGKGNFYVGGATTAADFPAAVTSGAQINGFQQICGSCQQSPAPQPDAFVVAGQEASIVQPALAFSTLAVNFGNGGIQVGTPGTPQPFSFTNTGDAPLLFFGTNAPTIIGPNANDFSVSLSSGSACPQPLQPAQTCQGEVSFTPEGAGAEQAFFAISDNAPGSPQLLEIVGKGVSPLSVAPGSFVFGSVPVGTISGIQQVTLTSGAALMLDSIGLATSGSPFATVMRSDSCTSGQQFNAGSVCSVYYYFQPTAAGAARANVLVEYTVSGASQQTEMIPLVGVGIPAAPIASVRPTQLAFGTESVGAASGPQIVVIANTGVGPLGFTQPLGFTGANPTDFQEADNCLTTLAPGAACAVYIRFAPQSSGGKSANFTVTDNAAGSPQMVAVTGTGGAVPSVSVSPSSWGFGNQGVGSSSTPEDVTITNTGSTALSFTKGISIIGANPSDFSETNNCNLEAGLQPMASCTVAAVFAPTATGNRTATLSITDNATGSPQQVALNGTGVQAGITISPAPPINFGSQQAGTKSAAQSITLTSSGAGQLSISKISVSGANAPEFLESDNCPASSVSSCVVQIVFAPACQNEPAARSATLNIQDNAPSSPQTVPLSGTASGDFCLVQPVAGVTQNVLSGVTATFPTITINSVTNFSGNVTLACSSNPAGPTCTFSPSSTISVSPNVPGQFVLQAEMGPAVSSDVRSTPSIEQRGYLAAVALAVCSLTLLGAARPRHAIWARAVLTACGLAVMSLSLSACGAGLSVSDPAPQPASGSFTLTVTASDGSETQTVVPLHLNVSP